MTIYPDLDDVKKILVVKLRHLGDVLLTAPLFHTLRRVFPKAEIDAYLYKESFPMLEGHPAIDGFIGYDRNWKKEGVLSRICREGQLLWQIGKKGYDLVLNLTEGDRGVLAARFSGADIRVGLSPKGRWQRTQLTHIVKSPASPRHMVERHFDFLRRIGLFPQEEEKELYFFFSQNDRLAVEKFTQKKPFVLMHPTSRWRFKSLSVATMRQIAEKLIAQGEKVLLTAGSDPLEKKMAEEIAEGLDLCNLAGKISLKELGAFIDAAKLLICVDSLPLHLASALKRPVVAFFGPTSELTWGPWRNPYAKIITADFPCRPCYLDGCGGGKRSDCLERLSFEKIWEAISSQLKIFPKVTSSCLGIGEQQIDKAAEQHLPIAY